MTKGDRTHCNRLFVACSYDTGVVGGALLFMVPEFGLSAWTVGLVVTASTAGSVLGTLAAAKLSDAIGRRGTMRVASVLFLSAAGLLLWSPTVEAVLAGRLLMGGAIGTSGSVVPVYIAECAEAKNRGALATVPQLCISSGILGAYASALAVTLWWHGAWRLMLGLALLPAVAQAACVQWLLPESPRWLLRQRSPLAADRAKHALARLRGVRLNKTKPRAKSDADERGESLPPAVAAEFAALVAAAAHEKQAATAAAAEAGAVAGATAGEERAGFGALWREPALRRLALTCVGLQCFQQFSGINAVVAFTPQTLKAAGVPQLFAGLGVDDNAVAQKGTPLSLPQLSLLALTF
jgi:MFS family permease